MPINWKKLVEAGDQLGAKFNETQMETAKKVESTESVSDAPDKQKKQIPEVVHEEAIAKEELPAIELKVSPEETAKEVTTVKIIADPPEEESLQHTAFVSSKSASIAKITYGLGLTLNLGNYNSIKISVAVELPCDTDKLDVAYDYAVKWVSDRVNKEKEAALGGGAIHSKDTLNDIL